MEVTRVHRGAEVQVNLPLTLEPDEGGWSHSRPDRLPPRNEQPVPAEWEARKWKTNYFYYQIRGRSQVVKRDLNLNRLYSDCCWQSCDTLMIVKAIGRDLGHSLACSGFSCTSSLFQHCQSDCDSPLFYEIYRSAASPCAESLYYSGPKF